MPLRQSLFQLSPESHLRKCHVPCPIPFWYPGMEPEELALRNKFRLRSPQRSANSLNNIAATGGENGKVFALRHRETVLANEVAPYAATDNVLAASTDVGDVSWKLPVAQCFSPCFAVGTPLHTWQLVSQGEHLLLIKECCWRRKLWQQPQSISSLIQGYCKNANKSISKLRTRNRITVLSPKNVTPSPLK